MKIPKLQNASQPITLLKDYEQPNFMQDLSEFNRQKWLRDHTMTHYTGEDYFTGPQTNLRGVVVKGNKPVIPGRIGPVRQQVTMEDVGKAIHLTTNPLFGWTSPSQLYGAFRDSNNTVDFMRNVMGGNSGFFTEEYTRNHPILSTTMNLGGDVLTTAGAIKALPAVRKGFKYA